jgi:hypothetical protein
MMRKINLIDFEKWFLIALIVAFLLLWFKGCGNESNRSTVTENGTIKIPETKGNFKSVKPDQVLITAKSPQSKRKQNSPKSNDAFLQNQINELLNENKRLNEAYFNASDSLKKAMYDNAIGIKSFNHVFDNDTINIVANGLVRGEMQSIGINYKIKSKKIELPKQKEVVFRLLAGGGVGINKELNQLIYKLNLGMQNRKGNIIRVSFEQIGNAKYYIGEYDFTIFNIKR